MHRLVFLFGLLLLTGCGLHHESSKYEFTNGFYRSSVLDGKRAKVYVTIDPDSIKVFPVNKNDKRTVDTTKAMSFAFPETKNQKLFKAYYFTRNAVDIDILTIPFKYRPPIAGMQPQLNTNFNGALYLGCRSDNYRLSYKRDPLKVYKRRISHYGSSIGVFTGLGATAINPWVTNNVVPSEYDGAVFINGVAAIIGVNSLTFGVGAGVDHLIGKDKNVWIYQGKIWYGLVIGLSLN
jgi:hypothetical protein